jgi:lipopolysaccharide biosynthesis glycosyltransferase
MASDSSKATIEVAFASDAEFAMQLGVALTSLARAHGPGEVAATVLHDGMPAADVARIERCVAGRIELRWREIDAEELRGAHHMPTLSHATLFRLLLPALMPDELRRVIYLDSDVVVARSLRPLWEADLGDQLVGAVRDAGAPFPAGPYGTDWQGLGLSPSTPFFNAGMLLIPLDRWREEEIGAQALAVLRRSQPRWGDQDALNVALQGRWTELGREWNLQTPDVVGNGLAWALWTDAVEAANADPAVVHYTERDKPWHADTAHPLAWRWSEVLAETEWAGWRPRRTSLPRRAASRAKRAGRLLATGRSQAAT